ncbi:DUF4007 family protein [Flavobacterium johnsoniae]|uniref:DUF4007 domain-containing protein n=1 Tax=Flavobacterium johnsoniae (strain ATCC 17061 / DSM 2064 / JCM 8514 / BCRC 14874 / CCUG 350202 / NBRC 14942 / NCIMB 11054 / UW101) TaxID=376686 RepID=A5FFI8_FLAJ1|nr:DUF4007 family protein [Flavobacterium johnsoniae]ABQ06034.1 hypothetical protein Fjoh_3013 [Flavobacterium johnsoniae UW101]OXG00601.1 hypothetical protein B0A63_08775 [Flavobacterium johnsoniae UW101]WQG81772.1 DUF4007 family protein [Flavobacterium johnsoniae UW101]SHK63812.1 Protein of unknown function [Flavobacterium johnsoniae]
MSELLTSPYNKLTLSGHETFHCRQLWLKKGYDFVNNGNKFTDVEAVVLLGVGKNMVASIYFWMKAFSLIDGEGKLTSLAHYIFSSEGKDPFLEDEATLWLLHYHLVNQGFSSIYDLIFNYLRREKIEFTKENFLLFVQRKANEIGFTQFNKKTAGTDFDVLTKMYIRTTDQVKDKEDTFSGLLADLNLIQEEKKQTSLYSIPNESRNNLPEEIILYTILDKQDFQNSVSLNMLFQDRNQAGSVFGITKNALMEKLESLANNPKYKKYGVTLSDHAGIKELQFVSKPDKFEILNHYYGN